MIIGVPAETKVHEYRTALTPDGARTLRADGHEVRVQRGAGRRAGHTDDAYAAAGARLVDAAESPGGRAVLVHEVGGCAAARLTVGAKGGLPIGLYRVAVLLEILGRPTTVELEHHQVLTTET